MLIAVLVFIGYAFNLSHGARIISLPLSHSNNTLAPTNYSKKTISDVTPQNDYVKLQPGSKIYFYTTEDENLVIGPMLQSENDVSILLLNQDDDLNEYSQFKTSYVKPDLYAVLQNGVLVPRPNKRENPPPDGECNKCVYQSFKPTYYVKGFKNILIPVDVLYSKSKQEELFNREKLEKAFIEPNCWRTDLNLTGVKTHTEKPVVELKSKTSNWSRMKSISKSSPLNLIESRTMNPVIADDDLHPDKNCNGDVTLFVLKSDGVLKRIPSDPFLPVGMRLSYSLLKNLMLKPSFFGASDVDLSYLTGKDGELIPHSENVHKMESEDGHSVSFMLSKNGGLFPVEERNGNDGIGYYFNGNLVHRGKQFTETFSNSTVVFVNDKKVQVFENTKESRQYKPEETHHRRKRSNCYNNYDRNPPQRGVIERGMRQPIDRVEYVPRSQLVQMMNESPVVNRKTELISPQNMKYDSNPSCAMQGAYPPESYDQAEEPPMEQPCRTWDNPPLRPRSDIFIFDDKGVMIRLIPEITETNDVVIYKLTCKGKLVRYPPCKEPEYGFDIHFQLLLDEFVLVPCMNNNKPFTITYVLQENGDLIPAEDNNNTFRKAPGSLIYFILGKNNILFPVQQIIDMDNNVSFFYQGYFLLKMKDSPEKPLHFTTKGAPLFAFYNGFTMITISSRPKLNPSRGSNWRQVKPSIGTDPPPKSMYLTGPKGELIKITPYKNKQGSTVVYELDCNGIFYRSPKDKKKCIILKSYILLKEGILLPSNDTSGYVFMMSKNGDLFPYLYPDGKIEAPLASSVKYVLCEKGILLPIKLEIIDSHICYKFREVVVYKERIFCKSCLDRLDEEQFNCSCGIKKSSCQLQKKEPNKREESIKLFINKDGDNVFYKKHDKLLKRYPPEDVPEYLKYTMGSFEMKPDGSLYQVRYQDPNEYVVNLMLEPNGDLLEDTRNINKARSDYYILDAKGNLIAVEVKKTQKNLHFYKNQLRICRVPVPDVRVETVEVPKEEDAKILPLGKDPLGLMNEPLPAKSDNENNTQSLYIPIPLKSVSIGDMPQSCSECSDMKKYEAVKETLSQASKNSSPPLALELELTDEIIEELKNWASKCDKIINRRDISDKLEKYITKLNTVNTTDEKI